MNMKDLDILTLALLATNFCEANYVRKQDGVTPSTSKLVPSFEQGTKGVGASYDFVGYVRKHDGVTPSVSKPPPSFEQDMTGEGVSYELAGSVPSVVRKTHEAEHMQVDAHGNIEKSTDDMDKALAISMARVHELESELSNHKNRILELEATLENTRTACAEKKTLPHDDVAARVDATGTNASSLRGTHEMAPESVRWTATYNHVNLYYGGDFDLLEADINRNRNTHGRKSLMEQVLEYEPKDVEVDAGDPDRAKLSKGLLETSVEDDQAKPYTCVTGQTHRGSHYLFQTADNSKTACATKCSATDGCVAFDFTTKSKSDACRGVEAGQTPRLLDAGADNRQYCTEAQQGCISSSDLRDWANGWDGAMNFECNEGGLSNQVITRLYSVHENDKEDRRWKFGCSTSCRPVNVSTGQFTNDLNDWDGELDFVCPPNTIVTGFRSHHSNDHEDRKWRLQCSAIEHGSVVENLWSSYINDWDNIMDFTCPSNKVLTGVHSHHSNAKEDRRWRVRCGTILPAQVHANVHGRALLFVGCYSSQDAFGAIKEYAGDGGSLNGGVSAALSAKYAYVAIANNASNGHRMIFPNSPTTAADLPDYACNKGCDTGPGPCGCGDGYNSCATNKAWAVWQILPADYFITSVNVLDCPSGTYRIESSYGCETAADLLGYHYMGASAFYMHPRGCAIDLDNKITHNFVSPPAGQPSKTEKLLCARTNTCATHLCPDGQQHKLDTETLTNPTDSKCCEVKAQGAECMERALCEAEIGELKNDKSFMCDCVFNHKGIRDPDKCHEWLKCLHEQRSVVQVWFKRVLEFSTNTPLSSSGTSLVQLSGSSNDTQDACFDPSQQDVFSLDCDCAADLQQKCGSKMDDQDCLRKYACGSPSVCASWKEGRCPSDSAQSLSEIRHGLESRAGSLSVVQSKDTAEETLRSKCR